MKRRQFVASGADLAIVAAARVSTIGSTVVARALPQPSDDEIELERDMEYFVEPEEALGPRTGDLGE